MGIYRTSELVEVYLSKMRQKKGVNGNQTSMYGHFGLFQWDMSWPREYDMETVHNMMHFSPTAAKWAITNYMLYY